MVSTGLWEQSHPTIVQGPVVCLWEVMTYRPRPCCPKKMGNELDGSALWGIIEGYSGEKWMDYIGYCLLVQRWDLWMGDAMAHYPQWMVDMGRGNGGASIVM